MKRYYLIPFAVVALAVFAGCDSSDPTVDDPDVVDIPKRTVIYEVFGTYRTCDITYRQANGTDSVLIDKALDWTDSVKVARNESFLARVSATCADIEQDGKATLRLTVDGLVLESASFQGYGESGSAQRLLQPIG